MPLKQVIVVRADLQMGKGKIAAQVCHASLESYHKVLDRGMGIAEKWVQEGQAKIVLKVDSERDLYELYEQVKRTLPCEIIRDAGKTQINPGTATCIGIGPWEEEEIDKFTGKLKLL
ncbi:aminoacyl-tRNA hydrolase [Candidatus Micrarchaeota archaeon CG_4_10_14_0_2_um_filter_49_7]|nr:MAG: aminoacyl-tRNA hydrolase [Candidatus Micrarchaeota archaeon CG06_land_8_20_14_3_00_50_6]PIZ96083.1 MAG: aminoacyl-tRNA hydrolase [Candidatus Micrarchaeota archaeon CG_4_10_14_0_2_um_filter_49_7]HII54089.1 peptidyl-tRNA hydrolase [Candidatus Micrarchaeota archaeon]